MEGVKIVRASAGSGKTYNLAYEYVRNVVCDPDRYRHILAVTFTNKATEEMKARILKQINKLSMGKEDLMLASLVKETSLDATTVKQRAETARNKILHDYSNFHVLTIDKFFQRIIRAFMRELGIDANFNLELQTDTVIDGAASLLIDDLSSDEELRDWIIEFIGENISESGKWNVKDKLVALGKEIFKENRVREISPERFKAELKNVVFKSRRKAECSEEKVHQLAKGFMDVLTAAGLLPSDLYRGHQGVARYIENLMRDITFEPNSYVQGAMAGTWRSKTSPKAAAIDAVSLQLTTLLNEIVEAQRVAVADKNDYDLFKMHYRAFALIVDLRKKIDQLCAEENILPISDINRIIADLISGNDTPFIFEKTGTRFTHYMIDEFQDTSTMQWRNFLPLLHNAASQSEDGAVMLVGDVKQSIYRWRGGDWSLLSEKAEVEFDHPQKQYLKDNYRSGHKIVEFNNALIGAVARNLDGYLNEMLDDAFGKGAISKSLHDSYCGVIGRAYADLRQNPALKETGGYATVMYYDKQETDTEDPLVKRIMELLARGYRPCDIAVLVRQNKEACTVAENLLDYKSHHPEITFNIVTQDALTIGNSDVCIFVVACMGLAVDLEDGISKAVYNHWLGRDFSQGLAEEEQRFFHRLGMKSPQEAFEEIAIRFKFEKQKSQVAYLQAMHDKIVDFSSNKIADIRLFLDWWKRESMNVSIEMPQNDNSITITTIHKSKGLEFKAVILPYCNWKMMPIPGSVVWATPRQKVADNITEFPLGYVKGMATSMFSDSYYQEMALSYVDNLNMLYVALTRAVTDLHIMIPKGRNEMRIDKFVSGAFDVSGNSVCVADMTGTVRTLENGIIYEFGTPMQIGCAGEKDKKVVHIEFPTSAPAERIAVKHSTERYDLCDGEKGEKLHMRDYGVLMHRVFEQSAGRTEILAAIERLCDDGEIGTGEVETLRINVGKAFERPIVSHWFSDDWLQVRTEADLLLPSGKVCRPDRVMMGAKETMVVDYKFGLGVDPDHIKQVETYVTILKGMGYPDVKGFLWYINQDEVLEV